MKPYYKNELTTIYNGDCLEVMDYLIEQGVKVDAIITDPPYGSINGLQLTGQKERVSWDNNLDWKSVWIRLNKLIKLNANIILFNQLPYGFEMINNNIENLHHELIWEKNNCAQGMMSKIMPLKFHENIYIFRKRIDRGLQKWFHYEFKETKDTYKNFNIKMGFATTGGGVSSSFFGKEKKDWQLPSYEQYKLIQNVYPINFKREYTEFAVPNNFYKENQKSIVKFSKDTTGMHPTQKPLELMKYLIETYTKKGDLILDFTAGSFTTCSASEQLNRRSIGIELEKKYCDVGVKRLSQLQMRLDI
jgi:site-specific DNA-methyltransferase (adenine-specific)